LNPRSLVLFPILSAVLLAGCGGSRPDAESAQPTPIRARLGAAESASAAGRTAHSGTIQAEKSAAVSSRVMAMVTAVHVRLGDQVAAGQLLLTIDPTAAQGQLSQAQGAVVQAEAALALAARNYERYQALAEKEAASELELDLARTQYEQARGAVEQARGAVAAARSVEGDARVVAPFAGRVAQRFVDVGDLTAPGRPLIQIESGLGRRLTLSVPESLMVRSELGLGSQVPVTLDARPELGEIAGEVIEVSPGPDPTTHAYTVKIALPSADLPAGSAARAYLPRSGTSAAILVPSEAIVESGGLSLVVVRDTDGLSRTRVVTLGEKRADGRVEVLSGVEGGESVALGLASAPASGTPIEPAAGAPEGADS